jgi:hypothetical protein
MTTATCTPIVSVFFDRASADAAVRELVDAGFRAKEVGVITKNASGTWNPDGSDSGENAGEGALVGAVAGAGIGSLVGMGILSGVIPVIGPALMAGTFGVIASNAVGGAAIAGVVGALTGWGIPDEHARYYESEVAAGRTVVAVSTDERREAARAILRRHGGASKDPDFDQEFNDNTPTPLGTPY